jgi:DNA-binding HxlR family transcriptional regulator
MGVKKITQEDPHETRDTLIQEQAIKALKHCDLWSALRKFANPDIALISKALYQSDHPMSFGEIRDITGLSTNVLNHDLTEMRKSDIATRVDKNYCITHYGALLVGAIEQIKSEVFHAPREKLFEPVAGPDQRELYATDV